MATAPNKSARWTDIGSAAHPWNNDYLGSRKQFEGYTTDVFFCQAMRWIDAQGAPAMTSVT